MNKTLRRMLCLVLVLLLIASISAPAFAAVRPYATLSGSTTRPAVRQGSTCRIKFYLHSGSYTRYRGSYRARFDTDMYDSSATRKAYTNYVYFTGNPMLTVKYTFSKNTYSKGKWYSMRYRTHYLKDGTWRNSTSGWMYFKVV